MDINIGTTTDSFFAHATQFQKLAKQAHKVLQRSTQTSKWLPVKELKSFTGHAQYLLLTIPAARLLIRELHSVLGDKWGGRVRLTPHLRCDL
jgi:hypothetical protein